MTISCSSCSAEMPDTSSVCPACGSEVIATEPPAVMADGFRDRIAGAAAYFVIPAIVFLLVESYKRIRFVRFHSFQAIFFAIATLAVGGILRLAFGAVSFVPMGQLLAMLVAIILALGWMMLWLVVLIKALQGEGFKLPFIGELADKQASQDCS